MFEKIIDIIDSAQDVWTGADWRHENGRGFDEYYNSVVTQYCEGDCEDCETCRKAEADAAEAQALSNVAVSALQSLDIETARKALSEARSIEASWGDARIWGPVFAQFEADPDVRFVEMTHVLCW